MGLGKTIQAAAALRILTLQRKITSALLVVPASLIDQWRHELYRWAPELRLIAIRGTATDRAWQWRADAHVVIVSYETFRADCIGEQSGPRRREWDLVILDEAQKVKNRDVEVSRKVKQLRRKRSWAMTGTPLENNVDELASIMEFVDYSDGSFVRYVPGPELLTRHRELQLRRRKADVLQDLPPKQVVSVSLPLLRHQQHAYLAAERDGVIQLQAKGTAVRIQHVLELITRLKQLCNIDPVSGESAKLEDLSERLAVLKAEGHRALLFSQYTDDRFGVAAVARLLASYKPLTYTGGMSGTERDSVIQQFKSNPDHLLLILSLKAGGVGLNLQEASYVFHIDRWWNPAVERQAEDRSHRMGQTFPVTVYKYTCVNTIEERIEQLLAGKQQLFDEIVDDVSLDLASRLNANELFGLFGLERPNTVPTRLESRPTGLELEARCDRILASRGWNVERTARSHDGGVDLIATKTDMVGIEQILHVQCKDHARHAGVEVVRELLGILPPGQVVRAVIAAPGGLTSEASNLARQRGVTLWDEEALTRLEEEAREQD